MPSVVPRSPPPSTRWQASANARNAAGSWGSAAHVPQSIRSHIGQPEFEWNSGALSHQQLAALVVVLSFDANPSPLREKLRRRECHRTINNRRPRLFKTLGDQPHPAAVPIQNLKQSRAPPGKEQMTAENGSAPIILLRLHSPNRQAHCADQPGEVRKTFARGPRLITARSALRARTPDSALSFTSHRHKCGHRSATSPSFRLQLRWPEEVAGCSGVGGANNGRLCLFTSPPVERSPPAPARSHKRSTSMPSAKWHRLSEMPRRWVTTATLPFSASTSSSKADFWAKSRHDLSL